MGLDEYLNNIHLTFFIMTMTKTNKRALLGILLLLAPLCVQASVSIIPLPTHVQEGKGTFLLKDRMNIGVNDPALADAADYLKQMLSRATGYQDIAIRRGTGDINLVLVPAEDKEDEAYTLNVSRGGITIKAGTYRGVVNGISTLRQLLPNEIESLTPVTGVNYSAPPLEVTEGV